MIFMKDTYFLVLEGTILSMPHNIQVVSVLDIDRSERGKKLLTVHKPIK